MKNIFITLSIFSLVGILLGSCKKNEAPKEEKPKETSFALTDTMMSRIALDTVRIMPVKTAFQLNGKVTPDDNAVADVYPLAGGQVLSVSGNVGDFVQKGQTLVVIRSTEVASYDRELADAQNDLLVAEKNLKVQRDLFESRLTSEREVYAAQKAVENAQNSINRIKEIRNIYNIGNNSEYTVRAPISGFIMEKNVTKDMVLRSDKQDKIFTLMQTNDVWVTANVYETDISKVGQGVPVDVTLISYPEEVIHGKIDKIINMLDPETKTMKVKIKVPNNGGKLKPEMIATVTLYVDEHTKLPAVPSSAIVFDANKHFTMVFTAKNRIETREVEVVRVAGPITFVRGLKEGDVIISKNALFIYDAIND